MVGYDLSDNFIKKIAERYGSILTRSGHFVFFRDEGKEGGVEGWKERLITAIFFDQFPGLVLDHVPT